MAPSHPSAAILGEARLGSGVAVAPQYVLTAHYLVIGASQTEVIANDGRARTVARTIVDYETGLALLAVAGPDLQPIAIGAASAAAPGLPVFILTATGEGGCKGATGHVTIVGPFEAFWEYMLDRAIMTTAINPGLAGAPLLDGHARLLGIVTLGLAAVGRYSLAIPVDLYVERREQMEADDPPRSSRAWIGFYPQAFDGGVVVTGVVPGGPADAAELARGDLLLSLDGVPVATLRELYEALWRKAPGDTLSLQVLRDSSLQVVNVIAGDRAEFYK